MNFFDAVVECMDYVNYAEAEAGIQKQDLVDSIRARLSIMISRVMSDSTRLESCSSRGWEYENASSSADF